METTKDMMCISDTLNIENDKKVYFYAKRVFDVVASLVAVLILLPVYLITAVAIKLEDKGPVFYLQKRVGKGEKVFTIFKFRSMRADAEKIHEQMKKEYGTEEVSFKLKKDPRVTKVGRIIRKFNIDELPQLLNILKGDMSIVGPRPLPVYEYEDEQKEYGSKYKERYYVPQGLTCYWQISNRAVVSFEERMQMDVQYSKESNMLIDVKLIIHTFMAVISGKAEY